VERAERNLRHALEIRPGQPVAHWRLGLIALNRNQFHDAIDHLEIARTSSSGHIGVQKALGLAYLWNGQIDQAEALLRPFSRILDELDAWRLFRRTRGQRMLEEYAKELHSRIRNRQRP
jgi:predicted Zn-dependent protease